MTTATIEAPAGARSRALPSLLIVTGLAALAFVAIAAVPYFLSWTEVQFGPYWPRRTQLALHIGGGIVAILTGPVQLWLGLADRRMDLHRRLGTVYLVAVLVGAIAGMYMAVTTTSGWGFGAGLAGLALAWMITTGMAFLAIKLANYDQHKDWMIRSYVVTFGFVFFRILFPATQAVGVAAGDALVFAAWACWSAPLLVNEAVMQGRRILATQ